MIILIKMMLIMVSVWSWAAVCAVHTEVELVELTNEPAPSFDEG